MNWRNGFSLAFAALLVIGLLPGLGLAEAPAPPPADNVDPLIYEQLAESPDGKTDYFIEFSATADLSPAYDMNWHDRGHFVVEALQATANTSQANVKVWLEANGIEYTSFWIDNSLFVHADEAAINSLASFAGVSGFRANHVYQIFPEETVAPAAESGQILAPAYPWNITFPAADQAHSALAVKGQGIVIGGMDTGVEYTHQGLVPDYRGNLGGGSFDHTYSWHDPSNACGGTPCDTHGHGTHTHGIMTGDDDPALPTGAWIGMAPDAEWIHCLGCPSGSCSSANTTACAQWFLAPGGDANMRPQVVNHSWGTWSPDDCNGNAFQTELLAYRAADIVPAFASGNVGDWVSPLHCFASTSPANNTDAAGNPIAFATGAHGSTGTIDSYSSGGPSACNNNNLFPDVVAPGSGSCTTDLGNTYYCGFGGTSSASPHTAGCVALVRSADPTLTVAEVEQIIRDAANDVVGGCGTPGETPDWNNIYGEGHLDCYEAVQLALGGEGMLEFAPPSIHVTLDMGDSTTEPGVLSNVGSGDASFEIVEIDGGFDPTVVALTGSYPYQQAPYWDATETAPAGAIARPEAWGTGASIPTGARYRAAGATCDGQSYYVFGGSTGSVRLDESWRYDTATDSWTALTAMPVALMNMYATCISDHIYLVGGYDDGAGVHTNNFQIYDVAADSWTATTWPFARTPMTAAWNGILYAFGGNPGPSNETWQYNPASGVWTQVASMPVANAYGAAVTAGDFVFQIGGGLTNTVQRYDPLGDSWDASGPQLQDARMSALTVWYGDYVYVVSGGGSGGDFWTAWNSTEIYDPALWPGGSWSYDDEPVPSPQVGMAGDCADNRLWGAGGTNGGLYSDGNQWLDDGLTCHVGGPDVPWLSEDPINGTVPVNDSVGIDVTFDAGVPEVDRPGNYYATLRFENDTPYGPLNVPVTMTVLPPADYGRLTGVVAGLGHCDGDYYPIEGAEVLLDGGAMTLTTDVNGVYGIWLQEGAYTVQAMAPGHQDGEVVDVTVTGSMTTTEDLDLRSLEPCVSATPLSMEVWLTPDTSTTELLVLMNDGAAPSLFEIEETTETMSIYQNLPVYVAPTIMAQPSGGESYTGGGYQVPDGSGSISVPPVPNRYRGPDALVYYGDRATFDTDHPGLPVEGFNNTLVPAGNILACDGPFDNTTNNACFAPGGILDGIRLMNVDPVNQMVVIGDGALGNPSAIVGPNTFVDNHDITFFNGDVYAVGFDLWAPMGATTFDVYIYGPGDVLLGQTSVPADAAGTFWGVYSDDPITRIRTEAVDAGELFEDIAFGGAATSIDVPWLAEDPISGTISADGTVDVDVTFTALLAMPLGTYEAFLIVNSEDAMVPETWVSATMHIVDCIPVGGADFEWSPTVPEEAETVTFTGTVAMGDDPITYDWDFGDGATDSGANVTHSFAPAADYTVVMTATNCSGSNESVMQYTVTVTELPFTYTYLPIVLRNH